MNKVWGVTKDEKTIVTHKDHFDGRVILFDGKDKIIVEYSEYRERRNKYLSSPFKFIKCEEGKMLEETHADFIRDADLLKKESTGFINMYKSGSESQTALHMFFRMYPKNLPDHLSLEESKWIQAATQGAIAW